MPAQWQTTTGPEGRQSLRPNAALEGPLFHSDFGIRIDPCEFEEMNLTTVVDSHRGREALSAARWGSCMTNALAFGLRAVQRETTTGPKGRQSLRPKAALKGPLFHSDFRIRIDP